MLNRILIIGILTTIVACSSGESGDFFVDHINGYTPVKNQGGSQLCWAYAMLAAIETEHIGKGDSVNLSPAYVELMIGRDSLCPPSKRGMGQTLLNAIARYGVCTYDVVPTAESFVPRWVFFHGMNYTPKEFAHSVCFPDEYVGIGVNDDVEPYTLYEPQLPDNWEHNLLLAVPRDSLTAIARRAVADGHGVCWEGDISEPGFSFEKGTARLSLINGSTTDDHCMAIVGLAHDADETDYFIMKNSWGTANPYGGLMYMSADYLRAKTIALYLPRVCVSYQ